MDLGPLGIPLNVLCKVNLMSYCQIVLLTSAVASHMTFCWLNFRVKQENVATCYKVNFVNYPFTYKLTVVIILIFDTPCPEITGSTITSCILQKYIQTFLY